MSDVIVGTSTSLLIVALIVLQSINVGFIIHYEDKSQLVVVMFPLNKNTNKLLGFRVLIVSCWPLWYYQVLTVHIDSVRRQTTNKYW